MKRILIIFLLIGVAIALVGLLAPEANAIPAFARKYQTSCVTCHVAYPKLSAFGDAFRRNGFQFPEGADEEYIKEDPVSLGNEAYKEIFPKMIWPGQIPGTIPLAIRLEGGYHITPNMDITNDFHFPNSMVMIMGGTLGENLSFYSDVHLFEHGRIGFDNRAYVQFSELFERWLPSSALNIKAGQFTIAANPFSMHRDMIIITPLSLATYSPGIGANLEAGHHGATGSLEMTQRGVEIDGVLKHRLTYALGIGNGNGIGEADSTIKYDNNSSKDVHFRLAYKIGGLGFDGYAGEDAGSPTERSEYWLDDSLRIGAFAYLGKAPGSPEEAADEDMHAPPLLLLKVMDEGDDHDDTDDMDGMDDMGDMGDEAEFDMRRVGFDVSLYYQNLNLFGAVLLTKDDIPGTDHDPSAVVWFVESDYLFYPWLIGALRYEMVHFKSGEEGAKTETAKRIVPNVTIMVRPNMKFILESPINFEDTDDVRIMVDFDFVF